MTIPSPLQRLDLMKVPTQSHRPAWTLLDYCGSRFALAPEMVTDHMNLTSLTALARFGEVTAGVIRCEIHLDKKTDAKKDEELPADVPANAPWPLNCSSVMAKRWLYSDNIPFQLPKHPVGRRTNRHQDDQESDESRLKFNLYQWCLSCKSNRKAVISVFEV